VDLRFDVESASAVFSNITTQGSHEFLDHTGERRFVNKQQMHWTLRGAHLLLQTQTKVLNNEIEGAFRRWYPLFRVQAQAARPRVAAALNELSSARMSKSRSKLVSHPTQLFIHA
jgi:hypothetical protein